MACLQASRQAGCRRREPRIARTRVVLVEAGGHVLALSVVPANVQTSGRLLFVGIRSKSTFSRCSWSVCRVLPAIPGSNRQFGADEA